jgi:type II secretory ATPase GspE/PulE/Tfp pilus assembly ATPase PilB-like protein
MGVEPYLVASTIVGVMAQRLVRVLCPKCKAAYVPNVDELPPDFPQVGQGTSQPDSSNASSDEPGLSPRQNDLWKPVGCHECRQTGFSGRTGLFELLPTDAEIQHLCVQRASAIEIRRQAIGRGVTTLRQCGWQKVLAGETCVEEVLRITEEDVV